MKSHLRLNTNALITASAILLLGNTIARADDIVLSGIPMRGVEIRSISEGEIIYSVAGRAARRAVKNVILHLDKLPDLERAEEALKQEDHAKAVALLDRALTQAAQPWQRAWIHSRRAAIFNSQGQFTRASTAWGRLLTQQPETYWAIAMPACAPDKPVKSEVLEAITILDEVQEGLHKGILDDAVSAVLTQLKEIKETAPDVAPQPDPEPVNLDEEAPEEDDRPILLPPPPPPAPAGAFPAPRDDYGIEALIAKGNDKQARLIVERLVAQTGNYPLDRLLYQYGRVLTGDREYLDAAVRFMQCAILFPDDNYAAASLFETARLHAGPLKDTEIAKRLFTEARDLAMAQERPEIASQATEELKKLNR